MTYHVLCEILSRDPMIACNSSMPTCATRCFDHAQDAADFARQWVRNFSADDIPEPYRRTYGPDSLPRARVDGHGKKRMKNMPILAVWRKPDGSICEQRLDGK